MALIEVHKLVKDFRQHKRKTGLWGTVQNLFSREYITKRAVDHISFNIEAGEIVGYIGPNGAGKSTTIKMLTGILLPTDGRVSVDGLDPFVQRKTIAKKIGVVFGQRTQLWWDIPAADSFEMFRFIYRIPLKVYKENIGFLTDMLKLNEFWNIPVRQLSLGQRMRAEIAASFLHSPEIVYLDEPTIGLDVVVKENLRQFLLDINQEKKVTILLATHDLSDIDKICPRVLVIDKGKIIYDGSVSRMKSSFTYFRTLTVDFEESHSDVKIPSAEVVWKDGNRFQFRFDRRETTASRLVELISKEYSIVDITVEDPDIETVVRNIYEKGIKQ